MDIPAAPSGSLAPGVHFGMNEYHGHCSSLMHAAAGSLSPGA